jgi:hypothetical protein
MVSIQTEQVAKIQKKMAQIAQNMPSTKPSASDKAAAGPASTTSSSTEETPYYIGFFLKKEKSEKPVISPLRSRLWIRL